MSPPDRRSTPELTRTLSDLYPAPLASDPSELADQAQSLFQSHARAHERSLATHVATAGRLNAVEGQVEKIDKGLVDIVKGINELKLTMTNGFAKVEHEQSNDRTKVRTAIAVFLFVGGLLGSGGGLLVNYLTKTNCKPGEALIGDRCVPVEVTVLKR